MTHRVSRASGGSLLLVSVALSAGGARIRGAGAEIKDLVSIVRAEGVVVSFHVEDAFDEELAHAIETGLEVTFRYNVELKRVRGMWLDKKLLARQIRTTVAYDNLTKRYSLTREIDGEIDATEVVADVSAMRRFMTTIESLLLFDTTLMVSNQEYYLRVNGIMKQRNLLLLIPWDSGADWREAHFTYLP